MRHYSGNWWADMIDREREAEARAEAELDSVEYIQEENIETEEDRWMTEEELMKVKELLLKGHRVIDAFEETLTLK